MSGNRRSCRLAFHRRRPLVGALAVALAALGGACTTAKARQAVQRPSTPQAAEAQRDCEQGSASACGLFGRLLTSGEPTDADLERGMVLLELACGQDDLPACAAIGGIYAREARSSVSARARAQGMLSRACDRGAANACTKLARLTVWVAPRDRQAAGERLRRACELGDPEGCEDLALFEEKREIDSGDRNRVDEAFARACQAGRPASCHRLALRGLEAPASRERSLTLLATNCTRGYSPSCNLAAIRYAPLLSANAACEQAVPFAARSCSAGDSMGCALVDACDLSTPARHAAALERLHSACETDQPLACLYWGDVQEATAGHEDGPVRRAYGMACLQRESPGASLACARAGAYDLAHAGSSLEAERTISRLADQCISGSAPACCVLAGEYQSGKWVKADPARTAELRARACTLGDQRCCDVAAH